MVAEKHFADWQPMLDRLNDELAAAERERMYGELTLTVAFVNGVAMTEKIGVVKSRRLDNL